MMIGEKLATMKAVNRRNDEAMKSGFIKVQRLSNNIRVVIERKGMTEYRIAAQQYYPDCPYYWEVRPDGWRDTMAQYSPTIEGAKRTFDDMVRGEQRWLEQ